MTRTRRAARAGTGEYGRVRAQLAALSVLTATVTTMAMLPNPLPRLADDPTGATLGLDLPPGTLIDATEDGPRPETVLWHANGPAAPGAWSELLAARSVGLLPVLVESDKQLGGKFSDWDLEPGMMSYPGDHDPEEVLAGFWTCYTGDEDVEDENTGELLAPYGQEWPGLAEEPETFDAEPDDRAAEITASMVETGWLDDPRIALVHARRSADIPAAIGWTGPLNHENDVARLCAVLRSWEDRYGIRVIALSVDRLTVSVAAPPATLEEAEALAAEHFAFCPDNITQGNQESLREYARKAVLGMHAWNFWWD